MVRGLLSVTMVLAALAGCPGGDSGVGDSCGGNDDCDSSLQCLDRRCAPRCTRAPQCGDGYSCDKDGNCVPAHGQAGDTCKSEVDCAAGLSCQINGAEVNKQNRLTSSCTAEYATRPAGDPCDTDQDCRNGTCELGHCLDLCQDDRDCPLDSTCGTVPRVAVNGSLFSGCVPLHGSLIWPIPVISPSAEILLPVPTGATSAELVMSVDDPSQAVGAEVVLDPCGCTRYRAPCPYGPVPDGQTCTAVAAGNQFYSQHLKAGGLSGNVGGESICSNTTCVDNGTINHLRHLPSFGRSVLLMPTILMPGELKSGAYRIQVSSFWPTGAPGSAVPRVTAVVRMGLGTTLDLHFFFLDLADHLCPDKTGGATLNAARAAAADTGYFRDYVSALAQVFNRIRISIGDVTYADITDRHDLDALNLAEVGGLFALGKYATGINVFFVRSLSPIGVASFGPNPGPAGLAGTPESGIVIALDTVCYRSWEEVASLTAHQIARYMGLYHNVEPRDPGQPAGDPPWQDLLDDTDPTPDNLMYFSEHTGTSLSASQSNAVSWSAVTRVVKQ